MSSLGHPREPPPRALLHRLELLPPVDAVPQPLELLHAALVLAALELAERRRRRRRPVLALAEVPAVELPEGEPAVVALGVRQEVGERLVRVAVVVEAAVEPRQVVAAERALAAAVEATRAAVYGLPLPFEAIQLLIVVDGIYLVVGFLTFDFVLDE